MEGVFGVAGVSTLDRGVPGGLISPPSRDVRTVGRSDAIVVPPRTDDWGARGTILSNSETTRKLSSSAAASSLVVGMLLRCPVAAAASARWVRCQALSSGPEEPPRAPVTRVRRRRRVTREGAYGPSSQRPENEVSGADKDARSVPVVPAPVANPSAAQGYISDTGVTKRNQRGRGGQRRGSRGGRGRSRSRSPTSWDDAKRVNSEISSARSLPELRSVVISNDNAKRFNVVNVATAYSRLGRHVLDHEIGTLNREGWYLDLEMRTKQLIPELSGWAASSVTWSLARLDRDPGLVFWESLETLLTKKADELEPQGVANVLWAFAVLRRKTPPALRNKLEANAAEFCGDDERSDYVARRDTSRTQHNNTHNKHPNSFKPYEMTMAFWALTRFGESVSTGLTLAFEKRCSQCAFRLKPKELANVSSAYGRIGGGSKVLPVIAEACVYDAGLENFETHEFATTLWGFAKAECRSVDLNIIEMFREHFVEYVDRFDPRDVSLTMWALATLDGNISMSSMSSSSSMGSSSPTTRSATPTHTEWVVNIELAVTKKIDKYNPQDLSNLLWAFAKLGYVPDFKFQTAFEEQAIEIIDTLNSQNLANIAWAYAALGLRGSVNVLPLLSERYEKFIGEEGGFDTGQDDEFVRYEDTDTDTYIDTGINPGIPSINPTELVMVLWAYAKCGFDPGPDSMKKFERACRLVIPKMQPDELTQYVWACASLRYRPSFSFLQVYESRAESAPARYDTEAVTLNLWAYATLGLALGEKLSERFADELESFTVQTKSAYDNKNTPDAFKPQDLSLGFWASAVLVTQPVLCEDDSTMTGDDSIQSSPRRSAQLKRVVTSYAQHLPYLSPSQITEEGLSAVFAATLALRQIKPEVHKALRNEWEALLEPAERAWRDTKTKNPTVSKLQKDVGVALENLGIEFVSEKPVRGGLIRPDFVLTQTFDVDESHDEVDDEYSNDENTAAVKKPKRSRIVVEVDGPYHYSREPSVDILSSDGLEDWFSGGRGNKGTGSETYSDESVELESDKHKQPRGVGRLGDGNYADGGGRWPLGSTVLRNQLLRSWGMTVVTVSYYEWERLGTKGGKEGFILGLLEEAERG